jgi:hypothetical protein
MANEQRISLPDPQKENEDQPSLYRTSMNGKNPTLLARHARTPSMSAP